jgi:hypothetical protein
MARRTGAHINWIFALRVGPKSSSTQTKLSEHETNRGEVEKSEPVSGEIFEILGQPAAAIKPSESAFDGRPYNVAARGMFIGPGSGDPPFGGTRKMTSTLS